MELVILAAGTGSRYGGLKQLTPIGPNGETLLEYSAFDGLGSGFSRVALVIRAETEPLFRARLDPGMGRRIPISYVHQTVDDLPGDATPPAGRRRPWGTGHAVLAAESVVEGPFAVLNADDFYGRQSFEALAGALSAAGAAAGRTVLIGFEVACTLTDAGPVSRALLRVDADGCLREIEELDHVWRHDGRIVFRDNSGAERPLAGHELVSMNLWGFSPALFGALRRQFEGFITRTGPDREGEFRLPDAVQTLVANGQVVDVLRGAGEWCGVTFREDDRRAAITIAGLIEQGAYPKNLWA